MRKTGSGGEAGAGSAPAKAVTVKRRTVLAGAAASGLTCPGPKAKTVGLRLLGLALAADGSMLIIREHEQQVSRDFSEKGKLHCADKLVGSPKQVGSWLVPARAFGRLATFDMETPEERTGAPPLRRVVIIRGVKYGTAQSFSLRLVFARHNDTQPWTIAFAGAPWQDGSGPSAPVVFDQFCQTTGAAPSCPAQPSTAASYLGSTFAGRIRLDAPKGTMLQVRLDRDCAWWFDAASPGAFTAFGGAVRMPQLMLRWALESQTGKPPSWVVIGGAADGFSDPFQLSTLRLGDVAGHHIRLSSLLAAGAVLDLRIAPSPIRPRTDQVVVCLNLKSGVLDIRDGKQGLTGPVRLNTFAVTDTVLPETPFQNATVRQTISGDADPELGVPLQTPIGRLTVGQPSLEYSSNPAPPPIPVTADPVTTPGDTPPPYQPPPAPMTAASRLFAAAAGDQGGAREASVFAVNDEGSGPGQGVRRIGIALSLQGADIAVPDVGDSRLTFAEADLRLHFEDGSSLFGPSQPEYPRQLASCWVWAGPPARHSALPRGALDLSRAKLEVRRDQDLVKLAFRFHDLVLSFTPAPHIRPGREDCRVIARTDGVLIDNRPLLLVDFPPQHVMEEAVFRPNLPPLPDVPLEKESQQDILDTLAKKLTPAERCEYRQDIQKQKRVAEKAGTTSFQDFADAYAELPFIKALPDSVKDQAVYIGPFAPDDPDVIAAARDLYKTKGESAVRGELGRVLDRVKQLASSPLQPLTNASDRFTAYNSARANEAAFEQIEPLYGLFRDLWRDGVVRGSAKPKPNPGAPDAGIPDLSDKPPAEVASEFLSENNRPQAFPGFPTYPADKPAFAAIDIATRARFVQVALGKEPIRDVMGARLSGPSRLAFRINCTPLAGLAATEAGLSGASVNSPSHPGAGSAAYEALPFTLAALTDWSRHEPEVTRRARKLFKPLQSGVLPPLGLRQAEANDLDILASQGIPRGAGTVARRMAAIQATLVPPTAFETAIELPARLILSTTQDAVWLTTRRLPGTPRQTSQRVGPRYHPLWTARVSVLDAEPAVRAVWSPDLRPQALGGHLSIAPATAPLPGQGAPPRGPWAPWLIGPEQSDSGLFELGGSPPSNMSRFFDWLKRRAGRRQAAPVTDGFRVFRTSLDAWDRHNLVLQSAAYGLPVIGARMPAVGDQAGALIRDSGMFEPGDDFALLDLQNGDAVYRPVPLDIRELTLTALGGSLLHDTGFVPASGAPMLQGGLTFDGFAIQRWQHEVVLGRDVRAEVVYKGYLMPFCHRAALVKLTERTFLRTPGQGIKAVLRQRMFLRVKRTVNFPLTGQPHDGRLICARTVLLTLDRTPDLLDPTAVGSEGDEVRNNGRIFLGQGNPGLAFWPRTDLTPAGLFQFDCTIDGVPSRAPMLFLDKIAATNTGSLQAAAAYYNASKTQRDFPVNGRKIRFAPETVPGDTSLVTQSIRMFVHGRLSSNTAKWTGDLTTFENTPVLTGADQPSFYPGMASADIRLEQLERLSGTQLRTSVQWDGHYIRNGFGNEARPDDKQGSDGLNAPGLFLNLQTSVRVNMGGNGDRSGGIGRPNSTVVAVSRKNGPLSTSGMLAWRDGQGNTEGAPATTADGKNPKTVTMDPGKTGFAQGFGSLAWMFDVAPAQAETTAVPSAGGVQAAAANTASVLAGNPPQAALPSSQTNLLKSLFDSDAKLLGVVTLQELMGWVAESTGLPELKEAVDYGTKALKDAKQKIDSQMDVVRTRVLLPLRDVVRRVRTAWDKLDRNLKDNPLLGARNLSVAALFPEVKGGLDDLGRGLDQALAASDPLALGDSLGEVFASGRRFAHQIEVLAAHPVQRLQEAVEQTLEQQTGALINAVAGLREGLVTEYAPLLQALSGKADAVADKVLDNVFTNLEDLQDVLLMIVPVVPLRATVQALLSPSTFPNTITAVSNADGSLSANLPGIVKAKVRAATKTVLSDVLNGNALRLETLANKALAGLHAAIATELRLVRKALGEDLGRAESTLSPTVKATLLDMIDRAAATVEQTFDSTLLPVRPEMAAILQGIDRVKTLAGVLGKLRDDASKQDFSALAAGSAALARDTFGVDVDHLTDAVAKDILTPLATGIYTLANLFPVTFPVTGFATDLKACDDHQTTPIAAGSSALLQSIADGISDVRAFHAALLAIRSVLSAGSTAGVDAALKKAGEPFTRTQLVSFLGSGDARCNALEKNLTDMFCTVVRGTASLAGLKSPPGVPPAWPAQAPLLDALAAAGAALAEGIRLSIDTLSGFLTENAGVLQAGFPIAAIALALNDLKADANLASKAADAERALAQALATLLNNCLEAARAGALAGSSSLGKIITAVDAAVQKAKIAGIGLDSEASDLTTALSGLKDRNTALAKCRLEPTQPATLAALLTAKVLPDQTVAEFFQRSASGAPARFAAALDGLRATEARTLALAQRLQAVILGLPSNARTKLEQLFVKSQFLANLQSTMQNVLAARNDLYGKLQGTLGQSLAKILLADESEHYPKTCPSDGKNTTCDGLAQEVALLKSMVSNYDPAFTAFLTSWADGDGTASPLKIAAQAGNAVAQIARGKIMEALDLGSFRDAVEDALSTLVPTSATLSYDFNTTISKEPDKDNIFQPEQGAAFGIAVRGVVDLLHTSQSSFTAKAHLGAFDIKLIGGIIDALTLRFGGLSFEAATGAKPRFDVAYRSFKIGPALDFAAQLQPFLGPKDGAGPYVRPLQTGLGLEAGYGVDLGTIGVGATSFFNVKLGLSAELPFDDKPALFKVSLGLPTAPFTMSVLPFAGSGYFAILADGNGPIGFEASFEFGAGGAIAFGPLQAQARIQIGLYLRLELTSKGLMATVSGTFFAGGSASIWIFSFSTSLYVRLGTKPGGQMQGEATFTFSFSLGLTDFDYSVSVNHTEEPIGDRKAAELDPPWVQYAENAGSGRTSPVMTDAAPLPRQATPSPDKPEPGPVQTWSQGEDWVRYAQYFDTAALPECYFKRVHS